MFDDIRRVGEKIDNLLGVDIFPFNYPFSYSDNFLQNLEKWEFSIPMNFLWLVNIEAAPDPTPSSLKFVTPGKSIPEMVQSANMFLYEPGDLGVHSGSSGTKRYSTRLQGTRAKGWDIDQGKSEITRESYMNTGGKSGGCILAQGVVIPGEDYQIEDVPISNNMGFLPGKVGGNRAPMQPLVLQFRETNRSFPDLVLRPWMILASHMGLVARPPGDRRNIKANISIVQLAKTYQYIPLVERKIFRFYNCVPTRISSHELTHQDGQNLQIYTTDWAYTHYTVESLPDQDMGEYMSKEGFKKFVKDMANKLLSRTKLFKKIKKGLAKVERFVDKANKIKKKVKKVLGFLGGLGKGGDGRPMRTPTRPARGRFGGTGFRSDSDDGGGEASG